MPLLFPFGQYWWLYAAFTGGIVLLLALDLGLLRRGRRDEPVGFRRAAAWTAGWISLALAFNVALYYYARWALPQDGRLAAHPGFDAEAAAWQTALEFLTGYVVEYSLSVDNIFVFVLVFRYFLVPPVYQRRALLYGILGALVFRAVLIALGSVLMQFHWVVWLFGAFLVLTGVKLALSEATVEPERNLLLRLLRRVLPVTPAYHGDRLFVLDRGRLAATPLLVAVACLEATDIVFAIDSVPAIYALTREPLIVFTSNVFAILGLRSLYFLLGGAVERFHLLRYGLAVVLVFVGLKMVWLDGLYGGRFPIGISLGLIVAALATSIGLSLLCPRRGERPGPGAARRPEIRGTAEPTASR
jgi:tellurite resistance protein TerC